jgi:ubiquinone/menaquinone biosynthesis C-methylase UbiE
METDLDNPSDQSAILDGRQQRERDYHVEFAKTHAHKAATPVVLDVIEPGPRRPWNAYWTVYDVLMAEKLAGKRVLVPGCGFGEDAIRLAKLGAQVYAFDISPELLEIAVARAKSMGVDNIDFRCLPAEKTNYDDGFFNIVYFNDILHHVDVKRTLKECRRTLGKGGRIVANELYTHSVMQNIRYSWFVSKILYRRMVKFIYGSSKPYITDDERKINERELTEIELATENIYFRRYFLFLGGRLFPANWLLVSKLDRFLLALAGPLGRVMAGRVVIAGTVAN